MKSEKMMKGLVCHKDGAIELLDMPFPKLEEDTDAIVRVTLSTICTSDLHIMHGAVPRGLATSLWVKLLRWGEMLKS